MLSRLRKKERHTPLPDGRGSVSDCKLDAAFPSRARQQAVSTLFPQPVRAETPAFELDSPPELRPRRTWRGGIALKSFLPKALANRRYLWPLLLSLLLLLPCFWQKRIQAGDLSSHVYNAWLFTLVDSGRIEGLTIATQWTNVLFDVLLAELLERFGVNAAQRIAVSAAVLAFFWGAFAFISAVSSRRPYFMMPILVILSYGWVFHMGFFNFYISTAICLWVVSICWRPNRRAWLLLPLVVLASLAHFVPVAWAAGILVFVYLQRLLAPRHRIVLTLSLLGAIVALRPMLIARLSALFEPVSWGVRLMRMTGADQAWVYDSRYILVSVGLISLWLLCLLLAVRSRGIGRLILGIPFQLWILHAIGILLVPRAVLPEGYEAAFDYLPERLSLFAALALCAATSTVPASRVLAASSTVLAGLFLSFLHIDAMKLNSFEDKAEALLANLPASQRVVGLFCSGESRINGLLHVVDRACVGKCYSFANYEPSSGHFRLRAMPHNGIVFDRRPDVYALESGSYVTRPEHLPMYLLGASAPDHDLTLKALRSGDAVTYPCAVAGPEGPPVPQ
jgi:hypothetical protein